MEIFKQYSNQIMWLGILMLSIGVIGCGGGGSGSVIDIPKSSTAFTEYSLAGVSGITDEAAKTISVTLPHGTDVTALVATFATNGTDVKVGTVVQTSTVTPNNFTTPVAYIVTAGDGSKVTYTVTVSVASIFEKSLTSYSLAGASGVINEAAKTISVTLPHGTDVTALVATFATNGTDVKVGTVVQTSTATANNFTNPVAYIVTAGDGSTATYTVSAAVATSTAKVITSYSFAGYTGASGVINEAAKTISVTVPSGTNVAALVATFNTTGTNVKVGTVVQTSTATANNFTNPVAYIVTAGDGSTATYTVTVNLASPIIAPVALGTAGNFAILSKAGISTIGTTAIVGDIGVSPIAATAITGFALSADTSNTFSTSPLVTGKIYAANFAAPTPAYLTTAISDMEIAFTDAAGRTNPTATELGAGNITGLNIAPGLYKWGTGVLITAPGVTLTGGANDVWIFQIAQDLTVNSSAIITLAGGAKAKNVFWQVSGQTALGTNVQFKGNILSQTLISLNTGASLEGRTLAQTAVTLNANTIILPTP